MKLRAPTSGPSLAAFSAAALVAILLFAAPGSASEDSAAHCLGPAVGHTLEGLVNAHALEGMVPSGFRLERLDVKPDHLEIGYDDDTGPAVTVLLTLPGAEASSPVVARGPHFEHRIVDERGRASGPARETMLRAAAVVDRAIPDDQLRQCDGARDGEKRAPTVRGMRIEVVEVAIVLAALALVVVWRLWRRRPPSQTG